MIKILVINTVGFGVNGISAVIKNYYENMEKQNLYFEFITPGEPAPIYKKFLEDNDLRYHVFNRRKVISYMHQLYSFVKKEGFDIVHVHGNSSTMFFDLEPCKLAKVPIRISHSHNSGSRHPLAHKILHPFFQNSYTEAFACGEKAGMWLYGKKKFSIINNGINLQKYCFNNYIRKCYRQKLNITDQFVIGHVGNFSPEKNYDFLIGIAKQLKEKNIHFKLLLIGNGRLFEHSKRITKELNLENDVVFLGRTNEVENYLQAMDLFVLPSIYEGLPLTLIEASASGLPIYASKNIDKAINVTGKINFLAINDTINWTNNIIEEKNKIIEVDREQVCNENIQKLSKMGYDIRTEAMKMRQLFISRYKSVHSLKEQID